MTLALLALTAIGSALAAAPDAATAFATYQRYASLSIPTPSAGDIAKLEQGKIVKVRFDGGPGAPTGALGMVLVDLPRADLWLGSMDDDFTVHKGLIAYDLPTHGGELFRWYGHLDLPAPFSDRHFVIRTTVNQTLPAATDNTMWERAWAIEAGGDALMRPVVAAGQVAGLDAERFDRAVYTPTNRGAWIFLDVAANRTLFVYHCATSLGGNIPDGPVTRYIFWGIDEIMKTVIDQARQMPTHYRAGHKQWPGGDGPLIPLYE
jgi:hypothetical protein